MTSKQAGGKRGKTLEERKIKDSEEWDGSASRWDDAESYCNSCLINVNPQAGNSDKSDWSKDLCMLPVRDPGDPKDTFNKKAVFAAAGGRGITAVKKPDAVSQGDWDKAVKKAANDLVSAYDEIGNDPPETVLDLAGKKPKAEARWQDRATSIFSAMSQIDAYLWNSNEGFLLDLFIDDAGGGSNLFAVVGKEGKLYKSEIIKDADGYKLGDLVEVEYEFKEVTQARSHLTVKRQADGKYRWFAFPACTAVLNRSGSIDSRKLFDSFVAHCEDSGEYPYLTFYHLGEALKMGRADYVARDGYLLLISGIFDGSKLANETIRGLEADEDNYWGISIGFYANMESVEMYEVTEEVRVPVFHEGMLEECSILPEWDAASLLTTMAVQKEARSMNKKAKEELVKLTGDPDLVSALEEKVDTKNRSIEEKNLVRREVDPGSVSVAPPEPPAEPPVVEPPVVPPSTDAPPSTTEEPPSTKTEPAAEEPTEGGEPPASGDEPQTEELLIDDKSLEQLSNAVAGSGVITEKVREIVRSEMKPISDQLAAILEKLDASGKEINERFSKLELGEEERKQGYLNDLPAKRSLVISYRPRERTVDVENKVTLGDLANETLSKLPRPKAGE